jgi:menaquinone-dependent protoporphyrinogen oxidase
MRRQRILVSASSRHGATAEIAETITAGLIEAGHEAECLKPDDVRSLDGYDAVVIGSAIYVGRWLEPARRFTERFDAQLRARPVWLFSSGPIGDPLQPVEKPADGVRLLRQLGAVEHRVLAGRLNPDDLGWVERSITGMLKAPSGDFRDWDAIAAWTRQIAGALEGVPA